VEPELPLEDPGDRRQRGRAQEEVTRPGSQAAVWGALGGVAAAGPLQGVDLGAQFGRTR
jgi:hypothetical protein